MKKYIIMIAAAVLMAACGKDSDSGSGSGKPSGSGHKPGDEVTITATLPVLEQRDTKGTVEAMVSGGLKPCWSNDDHLIIGGETFSVESINGSKATLKGKYPEGDSFDIVYEGAASDSFVQKANGDCSHIRYTATLKGVNDCSDIEFTHAWAGVHGGSLTQSGCLCLVLNLPNSASNIASVTFANGEEEGMTLSFENGSVSKNQYVAYINCDEIVLSADKNVTITVEAVSGEKYLITYTPGPQTLYTGYLNRILTSPTLWLSELSGKGSESDPYIITNADEFNGMHSTLVANARTYYRLANDIDVSGIVDWVPVNLNADPYGIMFDGGNHTISNFKCTSSDRASMFGVLYGEVKDLNIANSQIITSGDTPCGTVAAWAGNGDQQPGKIENVHVTNGKVSNSGTGAFIGGIAARASYGTIVNCSFDGTVERTSTTAFTTSYYPLGGIIGHAGEHVALSNCSSSGTITAKSGRAVGGILGYCILNMDIADCSSSMNITSRDDVVGGIAGYYGNGNFTGCSATGDIEVTTGYASTITYAFIGGMLGTTVGDVNMSNCHYSGNITANGAVVGGLMGRCATDADAGDGATLSQCWASGKITGTSLCHYAGGLVGMCKNGGLTMSDCYAMVDIDSAGYHTGGLVGDAPKNSTIRNCYATGSLKAYYAIGGLLGRAYGLGNSKGDPSTNVNSTVENCIAFNPSIKTTAAAKINATKTYSGGAIIGFSSYPNTLKNCWRKASLEFDYFADSELNALCDHADSSPSSPLTQPWSGYKWLSPYHGKAAAPEATVSSIAQTLGWSSTIWDFSGDLPKFK